MRRRLFLQLSALAALPVPRAAIPVAQRAALSRTLVDVRRLPPRHDTIDPRVAFEFDGLFARDVQPVL